MRVLSKCGLILALMLSLVAGNAVRSQDVLKDKARWEWVLLDSKNKEIKKGQ